jgi:hypothetical protein
MKKNVPKWAERVVARKAAEAIPPLRNPERYCTRQEAADLLGVKIRALARYIQREQLDTIVRGRIRLVIRKSIERLKTSDEYRNRIGGDRRSPKATRK